MPAGCRAGARGPRRPAAADHPGPGDRLAGSIVSGPGKTCRSSGVRAGDTVFSFGREIGEKNAICGRARACARGLRPGLGANAGGVYRPAARIVRRRGARGGRAHPAVEPAHSRCRERGAGSAAARAGERGARGHDQPDRRDHRSRSTRRSARRRRAIPTSRPASTRSIRSKPATERGRRRRPAAPGAIRSAAGRRARSRRSQGRRPRARVRRSQTGELEPRL